MTDDQPGAGANAVERRRWNDEQWLSAWLEREPLTAAVTPYLLRAMALQAGERVLDIGCGGGGTTIADAGAVGPGGVAIGADLSSALIELAARRAETAGAGNASFIVADAQFDQMPGGPFDVAASQFGVMFFSDPVVAFGNIRSHLRSGGRLAFACWQSVDRNPWHIGAALAPVVPPPPPPAVGESPTGPFAFGDLDRTTAILDAAGFRAIRHEDYDVTVDAPAVAVADERQLKSLGVPDEKRADAEAIIAAHLDRFRVGVDEYRFPLAFVIFEATNP